MMMVKTYRLEFDEANECWAPINDDFPNYEVSTYGRVRNVKRSIIMKPYYRWGGYARVTLLNKESEMKGFYVHQLVSKVWINNEEGKKEVDHIDKDKNNNHVTNLRWVTRSENNINRRKFKNSSSKYKGVCFVQNIKKWMAYQCVGGRLVKLGYHPTEELAYEAIQNYLKEKEAK